MRTAARKAAETLGPFFGLVLVLTAIGLFFRLGPNSSNWLLPSSELTVRFLYPHTEGTPYEIYASKLTKKLTDAGVIVSDETTRGSLAALVSIDAPHTHEQKSIPAIALVQADVAYHYVRGYHPQFVESHPDSHVRAIAKVFPERLELWSPGHERPKGRDLDEHLLGFERVCAESVGSGTMVTVRNVKQLLGATWANLQACSASDATGQGTLCAQARAYSRDSDKPSRPSKASTVATDPSLPKRPCNLELQSSTEAGSKSHDDSKLIGLSLSAARLLENAFGGHLYRCASLKQPGKCDDDNGEYTIEWDALLVGDQDLSGAVVERVSAGIAALSQECMHDTEMQRKGLCLPHVNGESASSKLPLAVHPRILIESLDPLSQGLARFTDPLALKIILLVLLGLAMLASAIPQIGVTVRRGRRSLVQRIAIFVLSTRLRWLLMLLIVVIFHAMVGILIWLSEWHEHALASDTSFLENGVLRAMTWVIRYTIEGESEIELKSTLSVLWVGMLKAGWAVASAALLAGFVGAAVRGWRVLRMSDRIVVVGWNVRGNALLEELERQDLACELLVSRAVGNLRRDALDILVYKDEDYKQRLEDALENQPRAVIVLADEVQAKEEGQGDVDSWVCRQVAILSELRSARQAKQTSETDELEAMRILAEVDHEANIPIVKRSGADDVICLRSFATSLLAQTASKRGLREVFEDLFETREGTQEIYFDQLVPHSIAEYQTFERAVRHYRQRTDGRIPLGIRRGRKTILNPSGKDARFQRGDYLIVMAGKSDS